MELVMNLSNAANLAQQALEAQTLQDGRDRFTARTLADVKRGNLVGYVEGGAPRPLKAA
ncbi:hypothetical protein V474_00570 [Novosphingobium barchaimii LL02]|uniref:Uncharacterized protein n=2 Tax=Novosphingobium barchaimii TaxID=1420591 RepID=A0A0J7YAV2_9SPHN|nr:hypothetical protein V474_00570 [Novosphingobium barchaimii LL02]